MKLLTPWGLLGLIGIAILIIIYIIKPNYQQKFISSTYVWRLSKRYKKRKLPTSRLRDILIIICQILIVTLCAMILAKPSQVLKLQTDKPEVIAIIDSSASMMTSSDDETRFQRAVNKVRELSETTFTADGKVSVIIADSSPYFLAQNVSADNKSQVFDSLDALTAADCSYGESDLDSAVKMCESIIESNPETVVYLYTDTNFYNVPSGIQLKRDEVIKTTEWNASILDAYTEMVDNYYNIIVEVACYGRPLDLDVDVSVLNANKTDDEPGTDISLDTVTVACSDDATQRIVFTYNINEETEDEETGVSRYEGAEIIDLRGKMGLIDTVTGDETGIVSFDKITITINEKDSFASDNIFEIYGGNKNKLKMYYYSVDDEGKDSLSPFIKGVLTYEQSQYADEWDITYTQMNTGDPEVISGYDYYVFENTMPAKLPEDGFVLLINPSKAPSGSGFSLLGGEYDFSASSASTLTGYPSLEYGEDGEGHAIMKNVDPNEIEVSKYRRISVNDDDYKVLMTLDGYPALIYKETDNAKVAVLTFSPKYSYLGLTKSFPILMNNIFQSVFPSASDKNVYTVGESVTLNGMGSSLSVTSTTTVEYTEFPAKMYVDTPGSYTIEQTSIFGREFSDSFFVKIASAELNIFDTDETVYDPYQTRNENNFYRDLLTYFAAALVAILFIEWILHTIDNW